MPDSYSPLLIELLFVTDTLKVQIPAQQYLQSIAIEEFAGGGWRGTVTLFDPNTGFLWPCN